MPNKKIKFAFGNIVTPLPFGKDKLPEWKQVHGTRICEVNSPGEPLGDCDGVYTEKIEQPIAVVSADCVPILLARNDSKAVAALHAGWRGTYAQIVKTFCDFIVKKGQAPCDWVATIGPSIQSCCYEVSNDLIEQFAGKFAVHDRRLFIEREKYLNLLAINTLELKRYGMGRIDNHSHCTFCSRNDLGGPVYHSFRREKASVREYSVIEIISY